MLDLQLIELAREAIDHAKPVEASLPIRNVDRSVGAMLGGEIARCYGSAGLPDETIRLRFTGSAGQSFGAFLPRGVTMTLEGEANDYVGKGLSGGRIVIFPPKNSGFLPEESILVGNVVLYGATTGEVFLNGVAGERFAVRNSGASAVVEGVGDHGCEYMTNGLVVVLGACGRNFAAGMSGGLAYVLDENGEFARTQCNPASVDLEPMRDDADIAKLRSMIEKHLALTGSPRAAWILDNWTQTLPKFLKVFPHELKNVCLHNGDREAEIAGNRHQPREVRRKAAECAGRERPASDGAGASWLGRRDFWSLIARLPERRPVAERVNDWFEIYRDLPDEKSAPAGRAMHGLRRAVLPYRLPGQQHHSRTGTSWSTRTAGKRRYAGCTRPTIFPSSPAASAPRPARRRACWALTSLR